MIPNDSLMIRKTAGVQRCVIDFTLNCPIYQAFGDCVRLCPLQTYTRWRGIADILASVSCTGWRVPPSPPSPSVSPRSRHRRRNPGFDPPDFSCCNPCCANSVSLQPAILCNAGCQQLQSTVCQQCKVHSAASRPPARYSACPTSTTRCTPLPLPLPPHATQKGLRGETVVCRIAAPLLSTLRPPLNDRRLW